MAIRYAGIEIENDKKLSSLKIAEQGANIQAIKIYQEKCGLGKISGIILAYEADIFDVDEDSNTTRMPCGHVVGRDGMTGFIKSLIDSNQY